MARDNVVELILKLRDEASGALDRFEQNHAAMANRIKAGAAIIGGALLGLIGNSVRLAASFEETEAKFNTVFGDSAERARASLDEFTESTGRSTRRALGFAAMIQDTLVPLGWMRDDAADLSVEVVKLATDMSSFSNIPMEQVMADIQSAMVGNVETLRKYGVAVNQESIEAYAMTNAIWDGVGAITAQEKAMAILGLTLAGTADAQGDAVRTADSFTNTMRSAGDQLYDFQVELGQKLIPQIAALVSEHMPNWISMLEDIVPPMVTFVDNVLKLTDGLSKVITRGRDTEDAMGTLDTALQNTAEALASQVTHGAKNAEDATREYNEEVRNLASTLLINGVDAAEAFYNAHAQVTTEMITERAAMIDLRNMIGELTTTQLANIEALTKALMGMPGMAGVGAQIFNTIDEEMTDRSQVILDRMLRLKAKVGELHDSVRQLGETDISIPGSGGEEDQAQYKEYTEFRKEQEEEFIAEVEARNAARHQAVLQRKRAEYAEQQRQQTEAEDRLRQAEEARRLRIQQINQMLLSGVSSSMSDLQNGLTTLAVDGKDAARSWGDAWLAQFERMFISSAFKAIFQLITGGTGGFLGGLLGFEAGGQILHASAGISIPHTGHWGDRQLVAMERGEVAYSSPKVAQGMIPGMGSSMVFNVSYAPTMSTASPGEMIYLIDEIAAGLKQGGHI